jgi:bifunctional non-homologous end joining protein LigD
MFWRSTAPPRRSAGFIELCLLTPAVTVHSGSQWVHEIKHDGYRFICRREGNWIRVFSRRGHDLAGQVPRIMDTSARHPATSVTLDSESVACGTGGVTDLELLGVALGRPAKREVFLYAFDLVELEGRDTRREPWLDRPSKLARLLRGGGHGVRLSDHVEGNGGEAMFRRACLISSKASSRSGGISLPYGSGRSPDWVKVKNPGRTGCDQID